MSPRALEDEKAFLFQCDYGHEDISCRRKKMNMFLGFWTVVSSQVQESCCRRLNWVNKKGTGKD
jgi:hypothetical protein